jgi:hypothetical protein
LPGDLYSAEMEFVKVFGIQGGAEIRATADKGWRPLERDTVLQEGDQVRVKPQSAVHLVLDESLESMVTLAENARLKVLRGPVAGFSLIHGTLFLIREQEKPGEPRSFFRVLTRDLELRMKEGGAILETGASGTWLRVFAETAEVTNRFNPLRRPNPERIEETFKFFADAARRETSLERINAADFDAWQPWIKKIYQRKDHFAAERLEKEMASLKTGAR